MWGSGWLWLCWFFSHTEVIPKAPALPQLLASPLSSDLGLGGT